MTKPKKKTKRRRGQSASEAMLERQLFDIFAGFLRHYESCHHESWGGYCDCGLNAAKRDARKLLRSNAQVNRPQKAARGDKDEQ